MSDNGTINAAEMPVIEDMSWGDSKQFDILAAKLDKATKAGDVDEQEKYAESLELLLGKCIISLPRSWLDRHAPADLDYSQPGALDYVKSKRVFELIKMIKSEPEKAALEDTKN